MTSDEDVPVSPLLRDALRRSSSRLHVDPPLDATIRGRIRQEWQGTRVPSKWQLKPRALAAAALIALCVAAPLLTWWPKAAPQAQARSDGGTLVEAVSVARRTGTASSAVVQAILATLVAVPQGAFTPRAGGGVFQAFDIYVNAPEGVDGLIFDVIVPGETGVVVGLESGDAPFDDAPTYDSRRLASGTVRAAVIPAHSARGRIRIATISVRSNEHIGELALTPSESVAMINGRLTPVDLSLTCIPRSSS